MKSLIRKLHEGNFSCVIANQGVIQTFTKPGIADLYDVLENKPNLLKGASVADKVIGKGAAALMIQGGVREIYADLISQSAYALFVRSGLEPSYKQIVHHIENRDKTDWCPLEKACMEEDRVSEILAIIHHFIKKQKEKS